MIERLRNGGSATCGPYSVAYAGLLKHFHVPVRLVHVYRSSAGGNLNSHTFNEVWSFDLRKWVVEDVDYNIAWRDSRGIHMGAQEIQSDIYSGGNHVDHPLAPYFYRLVISTQTDFIGCSYLECQKGYMTHLAREGEQSDPVWDAYKDRWQID